MGNPSRAAQARGTDQNPKVPVSEAAALSSAHRTQPVEESGCFPGPLSVHSCSLGTKYESREV